MMTRSTCLGLFVALFISSYAHAFSSERCGTLFPKTGGSHYPWISPLYVSTMVPSTSSYFSSYGPCSMYGTESAARQAFVNEALVPLQADAARGKGEYINTLAQLSGCPENKYGKFASAIQAQYSSVFPENPKNPAIIVKNIDSIVKAEPELKGACVIAKGDAKIESKSAN